MSQLISARVPDSTAERLRRYASRKNRSLNEVAGHAFEEWLRQMEFHGVEFRDTPDGTRRAHMKNSRLSVAGVIRVAKGEGDQAPDVERILAYWPERTREWAQAALNYYEAHRAEIDAEIALREEEADPTALKRRFPGMETLTVETSSAETSSAETSGPEQPEARPGETSGS